MSAANQLDTIRTEINELIQRGDYKRAYSTWQDLKAQVDSADMYMDGLAALGQRIRKEARDARKSASDALEELLKTDLENFDVIRVNLQTEHLERASLQDDSEYQAYRRRINRRKDEKREYDVYQQYYKEVSDQWEQAQIDMQSKSSGSAALLRYYDRALTIARNAASEHPENDRIMDLLQQAEKRREDIAQEENIMVSGGQFGDFLQMLKYIASRPDDDTIMTYDLYGQPGERLPKEDALRHTLDQANTYVNNKIETYIDRARKYLDVYNPRGAQIQLNRADKFFELHRYAQDKFDEFVIRSGTEEDFNSVQKTTREALSLLQRAENQIDEARRLAETDVLAAWEMYQDALTIYDGVDPALGGETIAVEADTTTADSDEAPPGAVTNEKSRQARRDILDILFDDIKSQISDIETFIETRRFQQAKQVINALLDAYGELDVFRGSQALARVRQLEKAVDTTLKNKEELDKQLATIREKADYEPQTAKTLLTEIENKYDDALLGEAADYDAVRLQVASKSDVSATRQLLRDALSARDMRQVERAIDTATSQMKRYQLGEDSLSRVENDRVAGGFEELARQLTLRKEFLEAEQQVRRADHQTAIREMNQILKKEGITQELYNEIDGRLTELRREAATLSDNQRALEAAENALARTANEESIAMALRQLSMIKAFSGSEQRAHWLNLTQRMVRQMTLEIPFNRRQLEDLMFKVEDEDPVLYDELKRKVKLLSTAQQARDSQRTSETRKALSLWESIRDDVGGTDRIYVYDRINELKKSLKYQELRDLLRDRDSDRDSTQMSNWRAELNTLIDSLKASVADSTNALDELSYISWAVEADLAYVQNMRDLGQRRNRAEDLRTYARQELAPAIRRVESVRQQLRERFQRGTVNEALVQAKRQAWLADVVTDVMEAARAVAQNVDEETDLSNFSEGLNRWQGIWQLSPPEDMTRAKYQDLLREGFATIYHWYETHIDLVIDRLEAVIQDADPSTSQRRLPAHLVSHHAKLLLLDGNNSYGRQLLQQLDLLDGRLQADLDRLVTSLPTAMDTPGNTGMQKLQEQLADLNERREYLQLMLNLTQRFPSALEQIARTDPDELGSLIRDYETVVEQMVLQMQQVKRAVDETLAFVDGMGLSKENWREYDRTLNEQASNLEDTVRAAGNAIYRAINTRLRVTSAGALADLERLHELHPVMEQVRSVIQQKREQFRSYTDVLHQLQKAIENEQFAAAQRLLRHYPLHKDEDFIYSNIAESYTVTDVWKKRDVSGWETVRSFVQERLQAWRRIADWSDPFYVDVETAPVPPSSRVIGWDVIKDLDMVAMDAADGLQDPLYQEYVNARRDAHDFSEAVRQQVEYSIAVGDFDKADAILDTVLARDTELEGRMSLAEALFVCQNPPLALSDNDDATGDYRQAKEQAGSNRGESRLDWMETHRLAVYENYVEQAHVLRKRNATARTRWEELSTVFLNRLASVKELVARYRQTGIFGRERGFKGDEKQQMSDHLADIDRVIRELRQLCPLHPDLEFYRNQPVLLNARRMMKN